MGPEVNATLDWQWNIFTSRVKEELQPFLSRQRNSPGRKDRIEWAVVQAANDCPFQHVADHAEHNWCSNHAHPEASGVGSDPGDVCASGDERSVCEVDDVHHPKNNREPNGRKREHERGNGCVQYKRIRDTHSEAITLGIGLDSVK